ncbi:MAG TPA: HlyD family secretion protein [Hyphomicrobiales bacterium]|nr:HlyD family secretion protein [Hyphomicrobiales bacterium]
MSGNARVKQKQATGEQNTSLEPTDQDLKLADPASEQSPEPETIAPVKSVPEPDAPMQEAAPPKPPRSRRKLIAMIVLPLLLLAAGWYGYQWFTVGRFQVTTDDAYIKADGAILAAKVSGYVASVDVADNADVKSGAVIAHIDAGDYRIAVQSAKDDIAVQQAAIDRIDRQVAAQEAALEQAKAQLTSAEAVATQAASELQRQEDLAKRNYASHQTLEQANAANTQAAAGVLSAKAAVLAARAQIDVVKAQRQEAVSTLVQLQTRLQKAERDLSFTQIRAPFDGVLGNRAMNVGDYVQPGQRLASLIPLDAVYIDANFKETQLGELKPGQPVEIEVDAMPGHIFHGHVVSFAPASGSVFSLLPPDNATGNFTKVVQRIPVRVRVDTTADEENLLRPGMSVIVSVNTKDGATAQPVVSTEAKAAPTAPKP